MLVNIDLDSPTFSNGIVGATIKESVSFFILRFNYFNPSGWNVLRLPLNRQFQRFLNPYRDHEFIRDSENGSDNAEKGMDDPDKRMRCFPCLKKLHFETSIAQMIIMTSLHVAAWSFTIPTL